MSDISMSHPLDDLIETIIAAAPYNGFHTGEDVLDFIRSLRDDGYVIIPGSAIGGLPPGLVAKALAFLCDFVFLAPGDTFTADEINAIRNGTFEVPT